MMSTSTEVVYAKPSDIPTSIVASLDAVLVLGGGVPTSPTNPPVYVQRRCDDAAAIVNRRRDECPHDPSSLPILCLSAGTAHMPQLINPHNGLPVWESTASAAYLQQRHHVDPESLFVETTSYDTIGNAYFTRAIHTDVNGWRKLLIITNQFHIDRSKAIFDWICSLDDDGRSKYELYYLSSPDVGLSLDALEARRIREEQSLRTVQNHLSQQYQSMARVWYFLHQQHDLYTAGRLVEAASKGAKQGNEDVVEEAVKKSYGAS